MRITTSHQVKYCVGGEKIYLEPPGHTHLPPHVSVEVDYKSIFMANKNSQSKVYLTKTRSFTRLHRPKTKGYICPYFPEAFTRLMATSTLISHIRSRHPITWRSTPTMFYKLNWEGIGEVPYQQLNTWTAVKGENRKTPHLKAIHAQ